MNTLPNGKTRKNLADQIDRLDSILDGLSESVAAAVKDATAIAVEKAVETTLRELLSSPELLTLIGAARTPAPIAEPVPPTAASPAPRLRARIGSAVNWVGQKICSVRNTCGRKLSSVRLHLLGLWGLRRQLLVSLGIGTAAGLVAYAAGPLVAGLLGAVVGFTTSLVTRARLWLKHMVANATFSRATT